MQKKKRKYVIILLLVFIAAAVFGAVLAGFFDDDIHKNDKQDDMMVSADKATVMIMGVDSREGDVGRSDTLMVAAIDPKKKQAALLSVPRDTRVKIKGHGWDKINAAYAYGGHDLTRQTVEQFLGVPMDHYVIINMESFEKIIDAIGGIDIDVEKRMVYSDPWDDNGGLRIDLYPGEQHMDGKTAVTYVRYRDEEGDIGRIKRQQKFMKAVMDKVLSPAIIPHIPSILTEVFSAVKTDMSVSQMLSFFGSLKEAQSNGLKTDMVPGTPMYIAGISYWIPDITKLRYSLADTLGVEMNSSMRSAMERTAAEYKNAIPPAAKEIPAGEATAIGHMPAASAKPEGQNKNSDKKDNKAPAAVPKSEMKEPSAAPQSTTQQAAPVKGQATGKD